MAKKQMTSATKKATAKKTAAKAATRKSPAARSVAKDDGTLVADISSAAVEKATGHGWDHWLRTLDKAGAQRLTHKEIAALLLDSHGVSAWWSQSITVGYEQARGMRQKHEKPDGFSISASRTISAPASRIFEACQSEKLRSRWLPDVSLTIRKATPHKTIRITWEPGGRGPAAASNVEVYFTPKGDDKASISVQHGKLKSAAAGEKLKKWWGDRLDALKEMLESA